MSQNDTIAWFLGILDSGKRSALFEIVTLIRVGDFFLFAVNRIFHRFDDGAGESVFIWQVFRNNQQSIISVGFYLLFYFLIVLFPNRDDFYLVQSNAEILLIKCLKKSVFFFNTKRDFFFFPPIPSSSISSFVNGRRFLVSSSEAV